ncbi:hypothetical protein RND81_07G034600 [Saponaria officinalis]|uniref:RST domain-containing protein n=1 Tax=Saponaria officinalis TaxID=3572 RepID=A0AAW1JLG6_SAPOF
MDPSIMKLLEEDEDESMHSGADVEAFSAALNRDIEGGKSDAQLSQPDTLVSSVKTGTAFPQENNQASNQMYLQWQPSNQDENSANQSQPQESGNQEQRNDQSSSKNEVKEQGSSIETKQEVSGTQAPSGFHMQYKPMQVDGQGHLTEQNSGHFSQSLASTQMQLSGRAHPQITEQDRMHDPSTGSQLSNMPRLSGSHAVPVSEPVGTSSQRQKQIPFGSLLPIILPELDKDRAMQLQTLYTKLRRNEIPKDGFVRHMRNIVGDQMLRLAVVKMQAKSQNPTQQQHPRPPTGTASQFGDTYSFGHLHQKSPSTHPAISAGPLRGPSMESREIMHPPGSHGLQSNQMTGRTTVPIQGLTKQQQEHLHFSQSSFPMYGASTYQPYVGTNVSSPSTMVRPQPHDPQMRQVQFHQGFGSAHGDGTSQVVGTINVPKVERQNTYNDKKSVPGPAMPNMATAITQHNSTPWQAMGSQEQNHGVLPPMNYVKQEPTEQAPDKQPKAPVFQSHGPTFSSSMQVEQGKGPGTSNDELSARQNPGVTYPSLMRGTNATTSNSISSQMDADTQVASQSALGGPTSGIGGASKTTIKKPVSGQKKPLDALASSPPLPSKKQKVSGNFADQSIEHLNDVTAVSGVNLREEEEQLFSIPKDDNRVSEASRKAVLEEEDRMILQKNPLKKKLAEIMTRCGLKNLSNDVERCLSLCVEERLRALISSLIRISKQRADSEKSKHNTVVTSDVREQILMINQKARDEWEKKQAEADKLRKQNEQPDNSAALDLEKEKDEGRAKSLKVNKDEDDKMRTTAANVAARAAVGGDDMLSKWQLMAQARQKRDGGSESATSSQVGRDVNPKIIATSTGNVKDTRGTGRKDHSALSTPGVMRQVGRNQVSTPPPRVAPSISLKDVIAVLEREPQMAKSTIVYRLYDKLHADTTTE